MTELLTPDEVREITDLYAMARDDAPTKRLLRDREAICEKHIKLATEYRAAEAKLAKVREMIDSANARGYTHPILDDLTAILENQS